MHVENKREKLKQLNSLRGLFALEIIIGHVGRYESGIIYLLGKFMICSVAIFFFLSAYGMVLSQKEKNDYLSISFLLKKPIYLFLVAIFIYLFNSFVDVLLKSRAGYASSFISIHAIFSKTNWYIWELIFFYILFWICYKYFYRYRILLVTLITTIGVIILYCTGCRECWYASAFGFVIGLLYGEYDGVLKFTYSVCGIIVMVVFAAFGLGSLFVKNETFVSLVLMRNSICLAAIMITVFISNISLLRNNILTKFLTKYSTELYLSQFIWLEYMYDFADCVWLRLLMVVTFTVITAIVIVHPVVLFIKKGIKKCDDLFEGKGLC